MFRVSLVILVITFAHGCISSTRSRDDGYFIVNEVVALDKRPVARLPNLYPWEESSHIETNGTQSIVISNSCGFVKVVYRGVPLAKMPRDLDHLRQEVTVLQQMGEWCQVASLLQERPTLLRVRAWSGHLYVLDAASIYRDRDDRPFVGDRHFVHSAGLTNGVAAVAHSPGGDECFHGPHSADFEDLQHSFHVERIGDSVCITRGVYLDALRAN